MKTLLSLNYWYYSRPNEIFLDLDNKRAVSRAFSVLAVAVRKRHLHIKSVWMFASETPGHVHLIIVLSYDMAQMVKFGWQLWLANDRLRTAFILERWRCDPSLTNFRGDLLVGKIRYHRKPDDLCYCEGKHKDKTVTGNCPAMARLIGKEAATADYFTRTGRVGYHPVDSLLVPWGRVSMASIQKWARGNSQWKKETSTKSLI